MHNKLEWITLCFLEFILSFEKATVYQYGKCAFLFCIIIGSDLTSKRLNHLFESIPVGLIVTSPELFSEYSSKLSTFTASCIYSVSN